MVYFMRGSVNYEEGYNMSPYERRLVFEFIEERLEAEGKKMVPIY